MADQARTGLDPATGELRFDDTGIVVGPGLTLAALRAHAESARIEGLEPEAPAALVLRARIDGVPFHVLLHVDGERLSGVHLTVDDPAIGGTGWHDYDPEMVRGFHDTWLRDRLGRGRWWQPGAWPLGGVEYRYRWGAVGSYLHPQDMAAHISIHYG